MFFELSKLLNFFISPVTWIVLLLIFTFRFKKKKLRKICLVASIVVFVVFTNPLLLAYVKYFSVREYSMQQTACTGRHYRLALVMGGFATMNKETGQMRYEQDRADRLWEAVRLWKKGAVDRILITGDPTSSIMEDGSTTAGLFLDYMEELGIPHDAFILEQHARNTRENAAFTAEILKRQDIRDKECLLITSASHIKRSLKCFEREGLHPDFLPVNVCDKPHSISHRTFYPSWEVAVKWQELMNEWVGELVYKIMGYV